MNELKDLLMASARDKDMCTDGYHKVGTLGKGKLVDYYLSIPDWCLERSYPSLEIIREHFSDIEKKGVYVDKTFNGELLNDKQIYVFHNCKGTIKVALNVEKAIIPMLYFANRCRLKVVGIGDVKPIHRTEVPVYTFGKNDISARDNAYVKFNRYKNDLI